MDINEALEALAALSQQTRLEVFRLLVRAGPVGLAAGQIADDLGSRQNTMSSHLKILAQSGLVTSRREGRHIRYRADYETMRRLMLFLMEDCCQGRAEICRPVAESLATC